MVVPMVSPTYVTDRYIKVYWYTERMHRRHKGDPRTLCGLLPPETAVHGEEAPLSSCRRCFVGGRGR